MITSLLYIQFPITKLQKGLKEKQQMISLVTNYM